MARRSAINIVGVAFEGIGHVFGDGTTSSPLHSMFCTEEWLRPEFSGVDPVWPLISNRKGVELGSDLDIDSQNFEGRAYLLSEFGAASTEAEPFNANMQFSSTGLKLKSTTEVAELFHHKARRAVAELAVDVDEASDTTIYLTDASLADTLVYVGTETILLGDYEGTASNGYEEYTVTRGMFGSRPGFLSAGLNVYDKVPYWNGRGIRIYTLELNGATQQWSCRWAGRVDGGVKTNDEGTVTELTVREGLATLDQTFINLDQPTVKASGIFFRNISGNEAKEELEATGHVSFVSRVQKGPVTYTPWTWVQIGQGLYVCRDTKRPNKRIMFRTLKSPPESTQPSTLEPREVFVVNRVRDLRTLSVGNWASSTRLLTSQGLTYEGVTTSYHLNYPWHPLAIFAALAFSTSSGELNAQEFDILRGPYWSADLRWIFSEDIFVRLHTLIQKTIHLQVDQYMLGWGGEPVNFYDDVVRPLLHAYGFYFGMDDNGFLTLRQLKLPDVDDVDDVAAQKLEALPEKIGWSDGEENAAQVVSATVGGLPWESPTNQLVRDTDSNEQRNATFTQSANVTFDMRTVDPRNVRLSRDMLTNRMLMQRFGVPMLVVTVDDYKITGQSYELGKICNVKDLPVKKAVLVDKSGVRTYNLEDNEDFYGYIMGRRFYFDTRVYELVIMLSGDATIRWRAPAMRVASISSGSKTISCASTGSLFGQPDLDSSYFNTGDEIQVWKAGGTLRDSNSATIQSISNEVLTLSTWPFGTDPQVGDIVRLAAFGSYSNTGVHTQTDLSYTYLGSAAGTLPDSSDNHQIG